MVRIKSILFTLFLCTTLCLFAQNREKGERKQFSAEDMAANRTEMLKKELDLTPEQEKKIKEIYLKEAKEHETKMKSEKQSAEKDKTKEKRQDVNNNREKTDNEIKQILTSDQKQKYETLGSKRQKGKKRQERKISDDEINLGETIKSKRGMRRDDVCPLILVGIRKLIRISGIR